MKNYSVDLAHDGKVGLAMAKSGVYGLIVLDVMLPKITGLEICKKIREKGLKTPVIMLTARDTVADKILGIKAGANEYMIKPFSLNALMKKIELLLKESAEGDLEKKKQALGDLVDFVSFEKSTGSGVSVKPLEELNEINRQILDNAPISIITIDKEGNITSANEYFKNFCRTRKDFRRNIFLSEFFIRENLADRYRKLFKNGATVRTENCYEKNSRGEDKYLKITAVPLRDERGEIIGALSMAEDSTKEVLYKNRLQELNRDLEKKVKQRTVQLDLANAELEKVLKLKSLFMADLSHEMRTSLAIMQCNLELAFQQMTFSGVDGAKLEKETFGQIYGEIGRMSGMLADLMFLSNSDSVKNNFKYEKVDLGQKILSVRKALKAMAEEKKLKMDYDGPKKKIELMADENSLEKLLINLVKNAIIYNKRNGWLKIKVAQSKKQVVLSVEDGGIGIAPEHFSDIFERFYRIDKTKARDEGGSGLGLAICKFVALSHGGSIEVASQGLGKGSVFVVKLPREHKTEKILTNSDRKNRIDSSSR